MNSYPQDKKIVTIAKSQLSQLPAAQFKGRICVVEEGNQVSEAIAELRRHTIIGFDTETRPSFKKGQVNSVALIQLSTHDVCYLFRINKIGFSHPIKDMLEDPSIMKVGLSIHDDFHNLAKLSPLHPQGFVELQNFVKDFRIIDNSLSKIYAILFGCRISKGQRLTNWEAESLSASQQGYAALDAYACIKIYDFLSAGLFNPEESVYLTTPPEPQLPSLLN